MTLFSRLFRRRSRFNETVPTLLTVQRLEREAIQAAFSRIDKETARLAKERAKLQSVRK